MGATIPGSVKKFSDLLNCSPLRPENKADLRKVYGLEVVERQLRTKHHGDIQQKEGKCKIL